MTDTYEGTNCLVDVRALVMVRDDSTGGWIPMGGGGLSKVSVRKCGVPNELDQLQIEFFVIGKSIVDDSIILNCPIKIDFEYNRVMPTFHHWRTGDKRFGLTFQTVADARAFHKGLRGAIRELMGDGEKYPPAPPRKRTSEEEGEVFVPLDLPVTGLDSRSASESSLRDGLRTPPQEQVGQMSHFFNTMSEHESPSHSGAYDYLQFPTGQEYMYPEAEGTKLVQPDPSGSLKKKSAEAPPQGAAPSPTKDKKKSGRNRCRYCQEIYVEEDNRRGACEYAPDCMRSTIEEVTCVRAARCMMYHCMSDEEGEFAQHPCECSTEDGNNTRWIGLAFLSFFLPCLCLYPPLHGCYWCCLRVGLCGGRHRSAS